MSTLVVQNLSLGVGGLPNGSVTTDDIADSAITTAKIAAGAVVTADLADAAVTAAKMSGAQSGTAPVYGARAWVNFDGTGTVAIRASGNVTSITDNGVGRYTINFTTAMSDTNYSIVGTASFDSTSGRSPRAIHPLVYATSNIQINTSSGSSEDLMFINVAIFR